MYSHQYLFTSESVAPGHPDKLCDQISDEILDAYIARDSQAKVAIECFAAPNHLIIGGEVSSIALLRNDEIEEIARQKIRDIGYNSDPFAWDKIRVHLFHNAQSPEINMGVVAGKNKEEGAGDQGIMFGYACSETSEFMPATIFYAHLVLKNILAAVKSGEIEHLGPDGKSQVTLRYSADGMPLGVDTVLVSIQHPKHLNQSMIKELIWPIILRTFPEGWVDSKTKYYVNPTGSFTIGGPQSDTGLTGRKIIVDSYGGAAPHGGGAFSGKDPSKVDRSAAYAARFIAKNIVASGVAEKCLLQLSYAIGMADPLSIFINTFGTAKVKEIDLESYIKEKVGLSPRSIRNMLELDRPIYSPTATFGHFGHESRGGFYPWESTKLAAQFKSALL